MNTTPRGRGQTLDTSRGSAPLPAASKFSSSVLLFDAGEKRKSQYLDSKLGRGGKEKEKGEPRSNLPFPLEQVHGTNEVRCNKRLESGPSHVGTSAKPVLRSLGLIGRCWVPNCRAPPLARRREPQNCLIVRDVTDDRKPSLSKTATVPIVENELLR